MYYFLKLLEGGFVKLKDVVVLCFNCYSCLCYGKDSEVYKEELIIKINEKEVGKKSE